MLSSIYIKSKLLRNSLPLLFESPFKNEIVIVLNFQVHIKIFFLFFLKYKIYKEKNAHYVWQHFLIKCIFVCVSLLLFLKKKTFYFYCLIGRFYTFLYSFRFLLKKKYVCLFLFCIRHGWLKLFIGFWI